MNAARKAKVYYNSACPVCRAGIESQRGDMQACGLDNMEWIDIHANPAAVAEVGASLEEVRERLYVKNESGEIKIGAAALAELWLCTPRQRLLGKLAGLPILKPVTELAYNLFARFLYRWNIRKGHW